MILLLAVEYIIGLAYGYTCFIQSDVSCETFLNNSPLNGKVTYQNGAYADFNNKSNCYIKMDTNCFITSTTSVSIICDSEQVGVITTPDDLDLKNNCMDNGFGTFVDTALCGCINLININNVGALLLLPNVNHFVSLVNLHDNMKWNCASGVFFNSETYAMVFNGDIDNIRLMNIVRVTYASSQASVMIKNWNMSYDYADNTSLTLKSYNPSFSSQHDCTSANVNISEISTGYLQIIIGYDGSNVYGQTYIIDDWRICKLSAQSPTGRRIVALTFVNNTIIDISINGISQVLYDPYFRGSSANLISDPIKCPDLSITTPLKWSAFTPFSFFCIYSKKDISKQCIAYLRRR